jgi:hypothetical protein
MEDEVVLDGGVGNAGAVTRVGITVFRPVNPHTSAIHALLRHLREQGFDKVPQPLGIDPDGRQRFIEALS